MTDQPPTNPGDIWVTGQRRQSNGLFPRPAGAGGSGGTGDDGETHQQEVGDEDPTPGTYVDPCSAPATAREWNADGVAAQTVKDLRGFANQPTQQRLTSTTGSTEPLYGKCLTGRSFMAR